MQAQSSDDAHTVVVRNDVVCITLAGCGVFKPGVDIAFGDPLEAKLSDLKDSGQSARLSDLTDFSWDEVHLFNEYTSRERIEEAVGSPVIRGDSYGAGSLLVFEENEKIVKALRVAGDYLRADHPSWTSDVRVEPWRLGFLRLTSPAPNAGN